MDDDDGVSARSVKSTSRSKSNELVRLEDEVEIDEDRYEHVSAPSPLLLALALLLLLFVIIIIILDLFDDIGEDVLLLLILLLLYLNDCELIRLGVDTVMWFVSTSFIVWYFAKKNNKISFYSILILSSNFFTFNFVELILKETLDLYDPLVFLLFACCLK